jgi:bacteriocin-like protein
LQRKRPKNRKFVMAVTAAQAGGVSRSPRPTTRRVMMSRYIDQSARALNNDELDDNELDSVTGGLVVTAIIAAQPTTNGRRGTGGQIGS